MPSPTPDPRIILVGSGTCRIDPARGPVSACVLMGDISYVIDVGVGALERLDRAGTFENCRELHIHISHGHIDHALGISSLLQCLTWADDAKYLQIKRVVIHATSRVCELIKGTFSLWGEEQTQLWSEYPGCRERALEFQPGPDRGDWSYEVGSLSVVSAHLPSHFNHGVQFSTNNTTYAFTCDATEVGDELVTFCNGVDVCVFDLGHISFQRAADGRFHLSLDTAARLLAQANPRTAYATHVYLRHLQHKQVSHDERATEIARIIELLNAQAREHGFRGTLLAATDGMIL